MILPLSELAEFIQVTASKRYCLLRYPVVIRLRICERTHDLGHKSIFVLGAQQSDHVID